MEIYVDDNTGKYYTWDGSSFVEYSSQGNSPQIGSHGDESITDEEEKERQRKIDQEEKETPNQNKDSKSDEDRIKDITQKMSDQDTADKLDYDRIKVNQKEKERQKKLARKNADAFKGNKAGLTKFKADFSKFIKNEVASVEMSTWSKQNRRYVNSPFIVPGTKEEDNFNWVDELHKDDLSEEHLQNLFRGMLKQAIKEGVHELYFEHLTDELTVNFKKNDVSYSTGSLPSLLISPFILRLPE